MAVLGQLAGADRRQRDPVLVGLDLGRDADLHARTPSLTSTSKWRRAARARRTSPRDRCSPRAAALPAPRSSRGRAAAPRRRPAPRSRRSRRPGPSASCGLGDGANPGRAARRATASTRCTETVFGGRRDRLAGRAARSPRRSASTELAQALEQRPARARAGSWPRGSRSWRRRSASRSAACRSSRPRRSGRRSRPCRRRRAARSRPARRRASTTGASVSSSIRVRSAYGTLKPSGGSRSRPGRGDVDRRRPCRRVARAATMAIRLVLPGRRADRRGSRVRPAALEVRPRARAGAPVIQ